ncbi:MAG: hypothetical protein AAB464_01975 [Patescibacteria group bacterium]
MTHLDPRLHFVVATAIIVKEGKFLIAKRAPHEKAFPNRWTVPGGKLVVDEYKQLSYKTDYPQWYNLIEWLVRKEVKEETGIEIDKPEYLCDLVFIRPDGYPVVTLSYWCNYKNGEIKLCKDLTDYTWVSLDEAKNYDLIEGIWDELAEVDKIINDK